MSIPYKTVAFHTLGCKLNFSESSTIARDFNKSGYRIVDFHDPADVYLINTCSVTENADRKCRKVIRQIKKRSPESIIAVTGCYAQLNPVEISGIEGVNLVVDNGEKFDIISHIENHHFNGVPVIVHPENAALDKFHSSYSLSERTRAFLKIQDGCDYPCTYCTIPLARGKSRSDSTENIQRQAVSILNKGIQEIVLTGVNVGEYKSHNGDSFLGLLKCLDKLDGLLRLRISSIEPNLLTDEILDFISTSRTIVPHFHIPLQSGSDRILKLMKRRYRTDFYKDRVNRIKYLLPEVNLGADVIVGFPGETNHDFQLTHELISNLPLTYLHVFRYSPRRNTEAYEMADPVSADQINFRSKSLQYLSDEKRNAFYTQFKGTIQDTLFESAQNGKWIGHTRNFIRVTVESDKNLENQIIPVKLTNVYNSCMWGEIG